MSTCCNLFTLQSCDLILPLPPSPFHLLDTVLIAHLSSPPAPPLYSTILDYYCKETCDGYIHWHLFAGKIGINILQLFFSLNPDAAADSLIIVFFSSGRTSGLSHLYVQPHDKSTTLRRALMLITVLSCLQEFCSL